MRLLVVGGNWPPETFIARKLEGLARAGLEVTVAANRTGVRGGVPGVHFIPLQKAGQGPVGRAVRFVRNVAAAAVRSPRSTWRTWLHCGGDARQFERLVPLAGRRADILHFEWNFAAVQYRALFDLMDCPVVISCRGTQAQVAVHNPARQAESSLLPWTLERAAAIHCVSQAIMDKVVQFGASADKIRIIRPAVDPAVFRPSEARHGGAGTRFRIVTTGSIIWGKGYEYALQALRLLVDQGIDAELTFIGGAGKTDRQRMLYTIYDLGLQDRTVLAGALPPAQVVEKLQASDAFLLASLSEGISNAVLEAMACGLPVVTTECGGMREAVSDGIEGFVTPVRDPQRMAECLERLARNPDERRRMGERARNRVTAEFRLADQTEKWVSLYRSLLSAHPDQAHPGFVGTMATKA